MVMVERFSGPDYGSLCSGLYLVLSCLCSGFGLVYYSFYYSF